MRELTSSEIELVSGAGALAESANAESTINAPDKVSADHFEKDLFKRKHIKIRIDFWW